MLGTADAMYSDGHRYRPLVAAFTSPALKPYLQSVRKVLVLGTGLASAVHVLHRYGYHPHFTLVEIDELVLEWSMEFLPADHLQHVSPVHADAFTFIAEDTGVYDLVIVDIFFGREVPERVTQQEFLQQCKARLGPKGRLVLNFMVNRPEEEAKVKTALKEVFTELTEISFGINKVYIVC